MKKLIVSLLFVSVFVLSALAESLLKPNDRIIFIGDSITGNGRKQADGWAILIDQSLKAAHPDANITSVSLGGSGMGVGAWVNTENKSRTESRELDVKNVDVKSTLDGGAEVVVIMLGVNDVLFPNLKDSPEDLEHWAAQYRELIATLRARVHPRVIALATPTLCTEDPESPKNKVIKAFGAQIRAIAKSENAIVLPTCETMLQILEDGRSWRPDFHVTGDLVHPNLPGHVAIAAGMLKGLGEEAAANNLLEKQTPRFCNRNEESLSYSVKALPGPIDSRKVNYRIQAFYHAAGGAPTDNKAVLIVPEGWRVLSQKENVFEVEGEPNRLLNKLTLRLGPKEVEIKIPPPWLIGTGNIGGRGWIQGMKFDPNTPPPAIDESLSKGDGFGQISEIETGHPLTWKRHTPGVNFGGGNAPGAIDMAAVLFFQNFDMAYGARWFYSEKELPVTVQIKPLGFRAWSYLMLWLNGTRLYSAQLNDKEAQKIFEVTLHKGWNALVFRSNNQAVQWQFAIDLTGKTDEVTNNLQVATFPPTR